MDNDSGESDCPVCSAPRSMKNALYYGDNLEIFRHKLRDEGHLCRNKVRRNNSSRRANLPFALWLESH
jgi:hypothetical protein